MGTRFLSPCQRLWWGGHLVRRWGGHLVRRSCPQLCFAIVGALTFILAPGACSPSPADRSTALRGTDLVLTTDTVAQQFASSDFLRARTAEAAAQSPILLRPDPLENLSDTRLTPGDQWAAISRVLFNNNMIALLREKNIAVQMPPLATEGLARAGITINEPPATIAPTHIFRSRLRSLTRAGSAAGSLASQATQRKDTFLFEYTIIDLQTRAVVWSGSAELARLATGSVVD